MKDTLKDVGNKIAEKAGQATDWVKEIRRMRENRYGR